VRQTKLLTPPTPRLLAILGGIALVAAPIAAAVILRSSGAPASTESPPVIPTSPAASFPVPPSGAVVFSRRAGSEALALGIVPRRGSILVQASVVGPQGHGSPGLTVDFIV
jgi:hypothetical protein